MSDITARAIADLRKTIVDLATSLAAAQAELAEFKANANKVTESMGSEILRLQAELEQQRMRAEAAEQEAAELAGVIRDVSAMLAQAQELLK